MFSRRSVAVRSEKTADMSSNFSLSRFRPGRRGSSPSGGKKEKIDVAGG